MPVAKQKLKSPESGGSLKNLHQLPDVSDADLVGRARDNDVLAESLLYRRHAPRILNLACRLLGDSSDADDVVQDSFIIAFEKLDQLRTDGTFPSWLRQIAVSQIRRRLRRRRLTNLIGIIHIDADRVAHSVDRSDVGAQLKEVEKTLGKLPDRSRIAWVMHRVERYSIQETSAALKCSTSTVKRAISHTDNALEKRFHIKGSKKI